MDQRHYIKFCVKSEIKSARIFETLTVVFGKSTISRTQIQFWYNQSKAGPCTSTTDENIEKVKKMIVDNHRITIKCWHIVWLMIF